MIELDEGDPGVYRFNPDGTLDLIHSFDGGVYSLSDILDYFELGEVIESDGANGLELDRKELVQLKEMVREYKSDHPPEFIQMCTDILHAARDLDGGAMRFFANF